MDLPPVSSFQVIRTPIRPIIVIAAYCADAFAGKDSGAQRNSDAGFESGVKGWEAVPRRHIRRRDSLY